MLNEDQLSWNRFYKESKNRSSIPKKISEFNRLVAHSKNFFVISGYGAFTPCYVLIISKNFIPSFGLIEKNQIEELNFLIDILKQTISSEVQRKSVVFEHGMCACIGGLDRAHIHIMSIPNKTNTSALSDAIDNVLYNRKAGIDYIEFNNYKLQNIHDINHIYEEVVSKENKQNVKIIGKLYKIKDIQNLSVKEWPLITLNHINKGGHYVYFRSEFDNASFLTTNNFQTQFGREVVFEIEKSLNKDFKKKVDELEKINKNLLVWRWQHHIFEKEVINSMKLARKGINNLRDKHKNEYSKFELKVI